MQQLSLGQYRTRCKGGIGQYVLVGAAAAGTYQPEPFYTCACQPQYCAFRSRYEIYAHTSLSTAHSVADTKSMRILASVLRIP
eukprot:3221294-Rhodomonas_salina.1